MGILGVADTPLAVAPIGGLKLKLGPEETPELVRAERREVEGVEGAGEGTEWTGEER